MTTAVKDQWVQAIVDGIEQYDTDGYDTARYFRSYTVDRAGHTVTTTDGTTLSDVDGQKLAPQLLKHVADQDDNDLLQCLHCDELGLVDDEVYHINSQTGRHVDLFETVLEDDYPAHDECERNAQRAGW